MVPTLVLMVAPVQHAAWMLAVPFLGQNQLILKVLRAERIERGRMDGQPGRRAGARGGRVGRRRAAVSPRATRRVALSRQPHRRWLSGDRSRRRRGERRGQQVEQALAPSARRRIRPGGSRRSRTGPAASSRGKWKHAPARAVASTRDAPALHLPDALGEDRLERPGQRGKCVERRQPAVEDRRRAGTCAAAAARMSSRFCANCVDGTPRVASLTPHETT